MWSFYCRARNSGLYDLPSSWKVEGVPPGFYFEITRRCNLKCSYCCAPGSSPGKELDTGGVIRVLNRMAGIGGSFVVISGGEPTIRPDLFEILNHAASLMPVSLVTNGTLIDEALGEKLARIPGLSVRLSLDGAAEKINDVYRGAGSFKAAAAGLSVLTRHFPRENLSLSVTVTSKNVKSLGAFYRFARDAGVGSHRGNAGFKNRMCRRPLAGS